MTKQEDDTVLVPMRREDEIPCWCIMCATGFSKCDQERERRNRVRKHRKAMAELEDGE